MGTLALHGPGANRGDRASVDHRADIYSLGVVFYEMLTGELPLGRFAPPSQKVQIDVRLDEVVLRALERKPEQRYQHASEIKTEVEGHQRRGSGRPAAGVRHGVPVEGRDLRHSAAAHCLRPRSRHGASASPEESSPSATWPSGPFAAGGVAMGGVAFGGVSVGLVSLGGLALGLVLAVGGLAVGSLAFGGLAVGGVALGGGAVGYYALGGGGWGVHALLGRSSGSGGHCLLRELGQPWPLWIVILALAVPLTNALMYAFIWCVFRFFSKQGKGSPKSAQGH